MSKRQMDMHLKCNPPGAVLIVCAVVTELLTNAVGKGPAQWATRW